MAVGNFFSFFLQKFKMAGSLPPLNGTTIFAYSLITLNRQEVQQQQLEAEVVEGQEDQVQEDEKVEEKHEEENLKDEDRMDDTLVEGEHDGKELSPAFDSQERQHCSLAT